MVRKSATDREYVSRCGGCGTFFFNRSKYRVESDLRRHIAESGGVHYSSALYRPEGVTPQDRRRNAPAPRIMHASYYHHPLNRSSNASDPVPRADVFGTYSKERLP
jgi:hypothetical protein